MTAQEKLGELFLQLAGKLPRGRAKSKTRVQILQAAYPHLSVPQKKVAKSLIEALETVWGLQSENSGEINCTALEKQAEIKIADWLRRRKNPKAYSQLLQRAAQGVYEGIEKLADIQEYAYEILPGRDLSPVGYEAFRDWLIELKIATPEKSGRGVLYKPGVWNEFWRVKIVE